VSIPLARTSSTALRPRESRRRLASAGGVQLGGCLFQIAISRDVVAVEDRRRQVECSGYTRVCKYSVRTS
jgi:hypothetical protein